MSSEQVLGQELLAGAIGSNKRGIITLRQLEYDIEDRTTSPEVLANRQFHMF